ncbi:MAG: diaminopimelate decarboxylase family protein [Candidatus Hodarchaeales archaeon]|jgi:diaminopimelate decarboxylase
MNLSRWNFKVNHNGHLSLQEADLVEIANKYKTPFYLVDLNKLENNCKRLKRAFFDFKIYYSYKTNSVPEILDKIHSFGFGAEIISGRELETAVRNNVRPDNIIFNGPGKRDEELHIALKNGVKINVDSMCELNRLNRISKKENLTGEIGIRINTQLGSGPYLSMSDGESYLGIPIDDQLAFKTLARAHKNRNLELKGLHIHLGTGIMTVEPFLDSITKLFVLIAEVKRKFEWEPEFLDIGGGFPSLTGRRYTKEEHERFRFANGNIILNEAEITPPEEFAAAIIKKVESEKKAHDIEIKELFIEPGRILVEDSEFLVMQVVNTKNDLKNKGKTVIMNASRLQSAYFTHRGVHSYFLANKMNSPPIENVRICGNLCTPMDVFVDNLKSPVVEPGDISVVTNVGAYNNSASSEWSFDKPKILFLENGSVINEGFRNQTC